LHRNSGVTDWIDILQWPAMVLTIAASWLVGSTRHERRSRGFWVFLVSNGLWVAWGWHSGASALVVLQIGLAVMNVRGLTKAEDAAGSKA